MSIVSTNWKTLSKKLLVKNKYLELWEDSVEYPDKKQGTYYVFRRDPFSAIIPIKGEKLILVRQFRYPVESLSWEFPMGYVEGKPPLETAITELKEETGMTAQEFHEIGKYWYAVSRSNQWAYVYIAKGLTLGEKELEEGEFTEVKEFTEEEIDDMIKNGEIRDGHTIAAYYFYKQHLGKIG